jgi:glucose-1-phosphate thymidylyltransferase
VLIHVAGKPILGHILDELKHVGVTEVVLVVGYMGDMVIDYVKKNYDFQVNFVHQEELLGLGHAILLTKEFFDEEPVMIVLGDTIFKADFKAVLKGDSSYIGVKEVADPRRFGVVELSEGRIRNFIEKPEVPPSNLAIVGLYYLRNTRLLFQCLDNLVKEGKRTAGEFQLTDALQMMLKQGEEMRTFLVEGWYDCGKPETLLETNRRLLAVCSKLSPEVKKHNIILEPVYIAESAKVDSSVIGPYVSIAEGSVVQRSVIRNTIVNENAVVKNILLDESLVGQGALVNGRMNRLNVGDSSQLDFT